MKREDEYHDTKTGAEIEKIDRQIDLFHSLSNSLFSVPIFQNSRKRHVYIIGKSGTGKTTLMQRMIKDDIDSGRGVGVIAPESELFEEQILPFIPKRRIDDVVYFNPADASCNVPLNPLHLNEGEDIDLRADEVFTALSRVIGSGGTPRINEILRQAMNALPHSQRDYLKFFWVASTDQISQETVFDRAWVSLDPEDKKTYGVR